MNSYNIQNIVSKYIHPEPEIVQDMVLEYWSYSGEFLDPIAKMVKDFRYVISPRGYSSQCGFVQGATYRLLFQNPDINHILIIAVSDKVNAPTALSNCKLQDSIYDTDIYTAAGFSDLIDSETDDIDIFESCTNQLIYTNTYQKINGASFLLLPVGYKDTNKLLKSDNIKHNGRLGVIMVANLPKYESEHKSEQSDKDKYISQNQNILDKVFVNKLTKKDVAQKNFDDMIMFIAFANLFYQNSPVLSMYYDTFRAGNKTANSYVGIVV